MNTRPRELMIAVWALVAVTLIDAAVTVGAPLAQGVLARSDVIEAIGGAVLWLTVAYFIYKGRGWLRYLYSAVFLAAVGFLVYNRIADPALVVMTALPVVPTIFWFLPASNRWFASLPKNGS